MTSKIRWALIGASTIADEWMVNAIRSQPDGTIEAVVSGSAGRAREFADKHRISKSGTNLDEILADRDIDAVYISSTNEKHLPQVLAAAAAGKHVLCEKPLALSEADASQMIEACAAHQVVLGTNHHLRCAATHRRLRELIRSGAVGTPLYVRVFHAVSLPPHLRGWRIERPDAGGGVVLDISVHDADTLRFILDAEPVEVSAMTSSGSMGTRGLADGVMGIIRFSNGVLAQIHDAFTVPYAPTGLEVHGTEGSLIARDVMTQRAVGEIELRSAAGFEIIEVVHQDLYVTAVAQFHRAVLLGEDPAATGRDGYRSLVSALALQESASTGAHVAVPQQYAR
ncbi:MULTISPECIES: Gfo/Idh/MocA family protein [unclassified Paraburkholderia]|uniref:Gfo/Idh/MocA family protein n=1 Tax=unclassified Paraburkholderia TaxID=2615204 RepID=UPI00160BE8D4|nr:MULTISPECIES: Gfo/Idh/MocA family oxidoreductase [unclassified Paraburkholderia]MBB5443704.1 1,5-anhydro-D-fructose reductase (1,5-anhydro-D-mannitol-forming) [Paraburkholderia sp. WSM4177]MBB5485169.1 1,5-anhydro-D-fructose reductase (1,5-anhydro-D-mannitol-forming) [Paraburkholderia sp. WSM4180]